MTAFIVQGDVAQLPLADRSVDLVFCSPPYEAARTYGIDFKLHGDDWVEWAVGGFVECLRVCKGLVAWVVEGQTRGFRWSATPVLLMARLHERGVHLRNPPIYHRDGIPGSGASDWLKNNYEFILCATNGGKLPWSDNTAMGHPPKYAPGGSMSHRLTDGTRKNQWGGSAKSTGGERGTDGKLKQAKPRQSHRFPAAKRPHTKSRADGADEIQFYAPPAIANPGNVITCNVGGGHMGSKLAHRNEAPFPESLVEFFVRSFCPPGGLVLDPYSGSGTTAAVAVQLGRVGVGLDIRKSQTLLSYRRVRGSQLQMFVGDAAGPRT